MLKQIEQDNPELRDWEMMRKRHRQISESEGEILLHQFIQLALDEAEDASWSYSRAVAALLEYFHQKTDESPYAELAESIRQTRLDHLQDL